MEMEQRKTNQFQDTSKASCAMIVALEEQHHDFGSDITPKNIVETTCSKPIENSQDSSYIKTSQQSVVQNTLFVENHNDEGSLKPFTIALDVDVNNNGLEQVSELLRALPHDEVAQESSLVLDDLAEIKQGLQQCFNILHQQAPRQDEVAQNIVETHQESSTREGDTSTKLLKKLDDVRERMQLLAGEFDSNADNIDELLRDHVFKFHDEVQYSLKLIIEKIQVDASTDDQDDEVKNHESCANVLDQNKNFNMIANQMHEDTKNSVLSSSSVAKPCFVNNQNLEVKGLSSRLTLEEGASDKQGDDTEIIGPDSSVDQDHDMRHNDREEPPQEETKEDAPSQEDVQTPDSTSHSSKIMQEEVTNKQGPPQDVDEVKDPSVEHDKEYDQKFPSLRPGKKGLSQDRMNGVDRSQEKYKAKHDDVEKKPMHKGNVKQNPEIIAEICKQEVAFVGTYDGRNRFSLGEYFTFTKTAGSKKAKKKPHNC